MRNIFIFVLLLAFFHSGYSQKLDRASIGNYMYTQLPKSKALLNYNTYFVKGIGQYNDSYRRDAIVDKIYLNGLNKLLNQQNSDITIYVEEYPLKFSKPVEKTRIVKYKKDGIEKSRKYYYFRSSCIYKYVLKIELSNGDVIYTIDEKGNDIIDGPDDMSSKKAYDLYLGAEADYVNEIIHRNIKILNTRINEDFCYTPKSVNIIAVKVKPKKYNYDELVEAFDFLQEGLNFSRNNEDDIEQIEPSITKAINIYENTLKESDLSSKKARVNKSVTAACYYNIGLGYMILKDFDNSIKNLNMATEYRNNVSILHYNYIQIVKERRERAD